MSSKNSNKNKSSNKSPDKAKIVQRNPVAINPLLKKSHAHTESKKAQRSKDKQALKKHLEED